MTSKREVNSSIREASILDLAFNHSYCYHCLCSNVVSRHEFCLECHSNGQACHLSWNLCQCKVEGFHHPYDRGEQHPFCIWDNFYCEFCERERPWINHYACAKERRIFIDKLQEGGLNILCPPPFKSFKK